MTKQTWLITGCSSGFGEQFVRQLTALGDEVIATGRNAETRLAHLKDTGATILDLDMTVSQAEMNMKFQQALDAYGSIDVVVNNAGFVQCGAVEELNQEELQWSLDTNLHGPINLTRSALPYFREKDSGWLVYMSSQCGFTGEPAAASYCASKFALEGAVESMAKELAWLAPGIKPLIIEPGIFDTQAMANIHHMESRVPFWEPLNDAARARGKSNHQDPYGDSAEMISKIIQIVKGTGVAEGRDIPLRIPFGSDSLAAMREKVETLRKTYDEWESVAKSTDIEGAGPPAPGVPKANGLRK